MEAINTDKKLARISVRRIYEKLGAYYDQAEIESILEEILSSLGFEKKESYDHEDFLKICRALKDVGGNARFCASLLVIDATLSSIRN